LNVVLKTKLKDQKHTREIKLIEMCSYS